jgi:hypothetical protein
MRWRLFIIMLMVAVVISNGFLTPSAQAEKSAKFDFWVEIVDPVTKKSEKLSIVTLDTLLNYVTVIKNNGPEYISTADVKYKVDWRDVSVSHIPSFIIESLPISVEWEREWEVNLKPGEGKRIEEMKSWAEWTKFTISTVGFTLTDYNVGDATMVVDGKLGPFTIKGIKVNLANCKGTQSAELFIDGKSFGKRSCEFEYRAKAKVD